MIGVSTITVVLTPIIAESLRRGFLKPLSSGVLSELSQPTACALYRLLDGHRHHLTAPEERLQEFTVGLVKRGRKARILNLSPDKIRRVLDPAHEELLRTHYLASVTYQGRGHGQSVRYVFEREAVALDPLLLSRLTERGIAKVACDLMEGISVDTVRERLEEVERLIAGRKVPGPGFFVNFIRSPDDYRPRPALAQGQAPAKTRVVQPRLLDMEPDPDQVARERFATLPSTERSQETVRFLKVIYGGRLNVEEYRKLGEALRAEAARALATGTCDHQAALLQVHLENFT